MARLTDISIRALPVPEKGWKIHHDELTGFGVRVTANGVKSFVLTYGANRERRTLGRYPTISLQDARVIARRLLAERTLSKHHSGRLVLEEALDRFVAEKRKKNRARTIDENERIIRKYFATLLRTNLPDLHTNDITRILDDLSDTPGTALHAFWSMRTFLRWCVKRRYIQHSPIEGLDAPASIVRRDRVLSDDELRTVWCAADKQGNPFGDIVKLLVLTGQRRTEIGSLRANWLNLSSRTCTLPSEITKNKRSHTFPICGMAAGLLKSHIPTNEHVSGLNRYLFPARGDGSKPFNGWSKAKAQLDKKIDDQFVGAGKMVPWTLHDLRRTYATNLQRLGVKLEIIEALLNHVSGTRAGIVGVYQRHRYEEEMRAAVVLYDSWFAKTILQS